MSHTFHAQERYININNANRARLVENSDFEPMNKKRSLNYSIDFRQYTSVY